MPRPHEWTDGNVADGVDAVRGSRAGSIAHDGSTDLRVPYFLFCKHIFNPFDERWNIFHYHIPDGIEIDIIIVVDKAVSHSSNFGPRNLGVFAFKLLRQAICSLTNNLHQMHGRILMQLALFKRFPIDT